MGLEKRTTNNSITSDYKNLDKYHHDKNVDD